MSDIAGIDPNSAPSGTGCVDCEAQNGWWFHLRRCAQCGHIGCCDDSLGAHATEHATTSGHPIVRSFEPGDAWFYDYGTGAMFEGPVLAPPDHHPESQTAPGPRARVPSNWQEILTDHRG
ncbi:UBP-type zinc finger domain-containing protein [Williamsia herbipolensis]|uniref:UBP-type zinc finger domain-containing protein n=1 Tax=Williamsia herbipolensis TaxID=1603258 RepID=A0AAU4K3Z9_9NOCA|nr:UBP-type zinc finger domain-containing protein [Williamsia herbipolensis]